MSNKKCQNWKQNVGSNIFAVLQLLSWLVIGKESQGGEQSSVAAALQELASTPGSKGLSVASAWLGELVVALSLNVKTYSSIRVVSHNSSVHR